MKIINVKSKEELANKAAEIFAEQIRKKPNSVLGLATGSTPIDTYNKLSRLNGEGKIDFSKVITFNLDEYVGLDENDEQSYAYFMDKKLFSKINIQKENTHILNGRAKNLDIECKKYDTLLKEVGGIDLQLLGIGHDGHIGFNEPADVFIESTHIVTLDSTTINANSRFFKRRADVPKRALTMGIKPIMNASHVLMLVSGYDKKDILDKAINGDINPAVPASILKLHSNVTVIYSE